MVKESGLGFAGRGERLYAAGKIFDEAIRAEDGLVTDPIDQSKHIITFDPEEQELASKKLRQLFSGLGLLSEKVSLIVSICEKSRANPYGYALEVRSEINEAFGIDSEESDDGLLRFPYIPGVYDAKDQLDVINRGHIVQKSGEYHASTGFIEDAKDKRNVEAEPIFKAFSSAEKFGKNKGISPRMITAESNLQDIICDMADFTKNVIARRVQIDSER